MESPNPAPPYSREADESAWKKVSNTFSCNSGGIPMPLSVTEIWKYPAEPKGPALLGVRSAGPACTAMCPPAGVNFTELERRLTTHWRILSLSTVTFCTEGETLEVSCRFFLKLCGRTDSIALCTISSRLEGLRKSCTPRASMRERSRIDEIKRKSDSPFSRIVFR